MLSVCLWLLLGVLMFCGFPILFSMGGISSLMLLVDGTAAPMSIIQKMVYALDSFPLLAVPFFILAGEIMNRSGVTERIFEFANTLVGHMHGGLGQVNVIASAFMAGTSGSAVSDVAGLGKVEIKAMTDSGYDTPFSAAVTAATATIGPIIPPSIPMVLYGSIAGVSVVRLFMGGIGPGILMTIALMVIVHIISKRRQYPRGERSTLKQIITSFVRNLPALLMPVLLLGSMLSGIMTPTEGACFACIYAIFLGMVVYRNISFKDLWDILKDASSFMSTTLIVIGMSGVLGLVLTQQQIPQKMLMFFLNITSNKWVMLLFVNLLLMFLGCLVEAGPLITILAPLLASIATAYQIDPIHMGVVVVFNLMVSLCTPPVGMCLFVTSKVAEIPMTQLIKEIIPFLICLFVVLILITYIPPLVTFLPGLMD